MHKEVAFRERTGRATCQWHTRTASQGALKKGSNLYNCEKEGGEERIGGFPLPDQFPYCTDGGFEASTLTWLYKAEAWRWIKKGEQAQFESEA